MRFRMYAGVAQPGRRGPGGLGVPIRGVRVPTCPRSGLLRQRAFRPPQVQTVFPTVAAHEHRIGRVNGCGRPDGARPVSRAVMDCRN